MKKREIGNTQKPLTEVKVVSKRHVKGLIQHSGRGSQFCSHDYSMLLEHLGITASKQEAIQDYKID